jgi:hypothetical protein
MKERSSKDIVRLEYMSKGFICGITHRDNQAKRILTKGIGEGCEIMKIDRNQKRKNIRSIRQLE